MTIAQASVIGARALGIGPSDFNGSTLAINSLATDEKLALTAYLGARIRANPQEFTPEQVATALSMAGLSGQPLADSGFSISDFFSEAERNAETLAQPLVDVGQSTSAAASSLASLIRLLPLVALVLAVVYISRKTPSINPV